MKTFILRATLCALLLAGASQLLTAADITNPGDPVVPSSPNHPGGEAAPMAIDNKVGTKYLNFDKLNTGFTVTPSGVGPIVGFALISANDSAERDPASYILEGLVGSVATTIASGPVPAFADRFASQQFALAGPVSFPNYRITFPTVANEGAANSMQIAEVQLLRALDVTSPADNVVGSSGNHPGTEGPATVFDNKVNTKYLNFDEVNTGLTVTLAAGPATVMGLGLTSANDAVERDPASYILEGIPSVGPPVIISSGAIAPFADRRATQDILFANALPFSSYRITFPTVVNPNAATSMQIAEIQLYGVIVPEPGTMFLFAGGIVALIFWRRRTR